MRRVFLGVDCGTQSTKVVLRDGATGGVVAVGRAPNELIERDDGTREQDPAWWIDALRIAVRDATRGERFDIGGIGVSGQQHGLVCLDQSDRPVRAAKLWNDTTTARECAELTRTLGGESRVLELTGNLLLPGYTGPKIAWLATHEPDAYARTVRMCLPHDYLNLWLTGEFVTEAGDASGTAFAYRDRPAVDPLGEAAAFCDSTGGWLPLTATLNCTSVTEWVRSLFGMDHADVDAAVASEGARGLAFLPYLSGERTPNRPEAAGVFVGLRADHGRDVIVRAVVEGVTFGLAYGLDALHRAGVAPTEVTLVGGGS